LAQVLPPPAHPPFPAMSGETVRVWDAWDKEISGTVNEWSTWDKVKAQKGFPGGLIAFLQTSTDAEGCGFEQPTIVQAYAWPILQSGQDLVGVAKTGSGKTLAFLLPGFIKLRKLKKSGEIDTAKGPALLCMTPTRELCYQIYSDAEKFGKPVQISAACAYGGAPKRDQEWAIKNGPDCLIATPGRLNDFLENGAVNLDQCRFAILDEADRMLDMGFEPQIRKIMDRVPRERQTAMFTATWPKECKRLAENYIRNPTQVQIGSDDITTNQNISQHIEVVSDDRSKVPILKKILGRLQRSGNCLVFCNTKRKCRDVSWEVEGDRGLGLSAQELHGDLDQRARDSALNRFRSGEVRVLVATDVAARGLDIRNISIVVNYDAPNNAEDYVHRIGRTGRAGDKGDAYTLLTTWGEDKKAANILSIMEKAQQKVPQNLRDLAAGRGKASSSLDNEGGGGSSWEKKDDWKKDDWDKKEDSWSRSDDKKDWGKDEWWKKDDKKEDKDEWWKKDDKSEWKRDDSWKKDDDWKKNETWKDDKKKDDDDVLEEEEPEEKTSGGISLETPGSVFSLLGKRAASEEPEDAPPAKVQATESAMEDQEEEEDGAGEANPEDATVEELVSTGEGNKVKVGDLKGWLEERGLPTHGVKAQLIERVQEELAGNC